jgi:hypothetical protein
MVAKRIKNPAIEKSAAKELVNQAVPQQQREMVSNEKYQLSVMTDRCKQLESIIIKQNEEIQELKSKLG